MGRFKIHSIIFLINLCLATIVSAQDARMQALMDAIKANPKDARAHFNLGAAYYNQQKYELAAPEFQKCIQIDSSDKQAKEMFESSQGISAYLQHNYSSAADHFHCF